MNALSCDSHVVGFRIGIGDPGWNQVRVVAALAILEALDYIHRGDRRVRFDLALELNAVERGRVGRIRLQHLNVDNDLFDMREVERADEERDGELIEGSGNALPAVGAWRIDSGEVDHSIEGILH